MVRDMKNDKSTHPIRAMPIKKSKPSKSRMVYVKCYTCGKRFEKPRCEISKHNFCCFRHFVIWNSKRMSEYDKKENIMNKKDGWTKEMRLKRREITLSNCKNEDKAYKKYLGRHIHRIVAEKMLGRKLKKGEVVHHIDGNKTNNKPENLMIFKSQSEHAKFHMLLKKGAKHGKRNKS